MAESTEDALTAGNTFHSCPDLENTADQKHVPEATVAQARQQEDTTQLPRDTQQLPGDTTQLSGAQTVEGVHLPQSVLLADAPDAPQETLRMKASQDLSQAVAEQSHTGLPQPVRLEAAPDAPQETPGLPQCELPTTTLQDSPEQSNNQEQTRAYVDQEQSLTDHPQPVFPLAVPEALQETSYYELSHGELIATSAAPLETSTHKITREQTAPAVQAEHLPQPVLLAAVPEELQRTPCQELDQERPHADLAAAHRLHVLDGTGDTDTTYDTKPALLFTSVDQNLAVLSRVENQIQAAQTTDTKLDLEVEDQAQLTHKPHATVEFESKPVEHTLPISSNSEYQTQLAHIANVKPEAEDKSEAQEHIPDETGASSPQGTYHQSFQSVSETGRTEQNLPAAVDHQDAYGNDCDTDSQTSLILDGWNEPFDPPSPTVSSAQLSRGLCGAKRVNQKIEEPLYLEHSLDEHMCREDGTVQKVPEVMPDKLQVPNVAEDAEMPRNKSEDDLLLKTDGEEGANVEKTEQLSADYEKQTKAQAEGLVHITLQIVPRENDISVPREATGMHGYAEGTPPGQALCFPSTPEHPPAEDQTPELYEKTPQTKGLGETTICVHEEGASVLHSGELHAEVNEKNVPENGVKNRLTMEHTDGTESPHQVGHSPQKVESLDRLDDGHELQNLSASGREDERVRLYEDFELNNSTRGNDKDNMATENPPDSSMMPCLSQPESQVRCFLRLPSADEEDISSEIAHETAKVYDEKLDMEDKGNIASETVHETDKEDDKKLETTDAGTITSEVAHETDKGHDKKLETLGADYITYEIVHETYKEDDEKLDIADKENIIYEIVHEADKEDDKNLETTDDENITSETAHETDKGDDKKLETTDIVHKTDNVYDKKREMTEAGSITSEIVHEADKEYEKKLDEENIIHEAVHETDKKSKTTEESIISVLIQKPDRKSETFSVEEKIKSEIAHASDKESDSKEEIITSETVHETDKTSAIEKVEIVHEIDKELETVEERITSKTVYETDKKSEIDDTENIAKANVFDEAKKQDLADVENITFETVQETDKKPVSVYMKDIALDNTADVENIPAETELATDKVSETGEKSITSEAVHETSKNIENVGTKNITHEYQLGEEKKQETAHNVVNKESQTTDGSIITGTVHGAYINSEPAGTVNITQEDISAEAKKRETADVENICETELEADEESETADKRITPRAVHETNTSQTKDESIMSETMHEVYKQSETAGLKNIMQEEQEPADKEDVLPNSELSKHRHSETLDEKNITPETVLDEEKKTETSDKTDKENITHDKPLEADQRFNPLSHTAPSAQLSEGRCRAKRVKTADKENILFEMEKESETAEKDSTRLETDKQSGAADGENALPGTDKLSEVAGKDSITLKTDKKLEVVDKENSILGADSRSKIMEEGVAACERELVAEENSKTSEKDNVTSETVPKADREAATVGEKTFETDEKLETAVPTFSSVSDAFSGTDDGVACEDVLGAEKKSETAAEIITSEKVPETDKNIATAGSGDITLENTAKADEEQVMKSVKKIEPERTHQIDERFETTDQQNVALEANKKSQTAAKENIISDYVVTTDKRSETTDMDNTTFRTTLETDKTAETAEESPKGESSVVSDVLSLMSCLTSESIFENEISETPDKTNTASENLLEKADEADEENVASDKKSEKAPNVNFAVENVLKIDKKSETTGTDDVTLKNVLLTNKQSEDKENVTSETLPEIDKKSEEVDKQTIASANQIRPETLHKADTTSEEEDKKDVTSANLVKPDKKLETTDKGSITFDTALKEDKKPETNDEENIAFENVLRTDTVPGTTDKQNAVSASVHDIHHTSKELNKDYASLEKGHETDQTSQTANDECTAFEMEETNQTKITKSDHVTPKARLETEQTEKSANKGGNVSETLRETEQADLPVLSLVTSLTCRLPGQEVFTSEIESSGEETEGVQESTESEISQETNQTNRGDKQCKSSATELEENESIASSVNLHETVVTERANNGTDCKTDFEEKQTTMDQDKESVLRKDAHVSDIGSWKAKTNYASLEGHDRNHTAEAAYCLASEEFEKMSQRTKSAGGEERTTKDRSGPEAERVHEEYLTSDKEVQITNSSEKTHDKCSDEVVLFTLVPPSTEISGGRFGSKRAKRVQRVSEEAEHTCWLTETADNEVILPGEMGHGDLVREKSGQQCTADQAQPTLVLEEGDQPEHIDDMAPSLVDHMWMTPAPLKSFLDKHSEELAPSPCDLAKSDGQKHQEKHTEQLAPGLSDLAIVATHPDDDVQKHQEKHTEETARQISWPPLPDSLTETVDRAQMAVFLGGNDQEKQMEQTAAVLVDQTILVQCSQYSQKLKEEYVRHVASEPFDEAHSIVTPVEDGHAENIDLVAKGREDQAKVIFTPAEVYEVKHLAQLPPEPVDWVDVVPTFVEDDQEKHMKTFAQEPVGLQRKVEQIFTPVEHKREREEEGEEEEATAVEVEETVEAMEKKIQKLLASMEEDWWRSKVRAKQNRLRMIRQAISKIEKSRKENVPPAKQAHILHTTDSPNKSRLTLVDKYLDYPPKNKDLGQKRIKSGEALLRRPHLSKATEEELGCSQFDKLSASEDHLGIVSKQGRGKMTLEWEHPMPSTSSAGSRESPDAKPYARQTGPSEVGDLPKYPDEEVGDLPKRPGDEAKDLPSHLCEQVGDLPKHPTEETGDLPEHSSEEEDSSGCEQSIYSRESDSSSDSVDLDELLFETAGTERPITDSDRTYISAFSTHMQQMKRASRKRRARNWSTSFENVIYDVIPFYEKMDKERLLGDVVGTPSDHSRSSTKSYLQQLNERRELRSHTSTPNAAVISPPDDTTVSATQTRRKQASGGFGSPRLDTSAPAVSNSQTDSSGFDPIKLNATVAPIYGQIPFVMPEMLRLCQKREERSWGRKRINKHDAPSTVGGDSIELKTLRGGEVARTPKKAKREKRNACNLC